MKHKFTVLNPGFPKKKRRRKTSIKRRKRNTLKRKKTNSHKLNKFKKGVSMQRRRKRTRGRKRSYKKNPAVRYKKNRRPVFVGRKRSRRRYRRNPEGLAGVRTNDLLQMTAGAAAGGIVTPWISGVLQLEGMIKYGAQLIMAAGLYYGLKKIMPRAAVPAAAAAVGVTAYQFAQEKGILAGLGQDDLTADDIERLNFIREGVEGANLPVGAVYPGLGSVYPVSGSIPLSPVDEEVFAEGNY